VRAGLPNYPVPGSDDISKSLSSLPDFRTNGTLPVGLPPFYALKPDTNAVETPDTTVREYLIAWHTDWVRRFGVDGFRCDTAKHIEREAWAELKVAATAALAEWKTANPDKAIDDQPFWMVGEVFPHGVTKDDYFTTANFDALINFDFAPDALDVIADHEALDALYASYAAALNTDPAFNMMSYVSSHDTDLFSASTDGDLALQAEVGTALLLAPGAVQIFYGDESARLLGPASAGDAQQGTRSDMNWDDADAALLTHWQKLGQFRKNHVAVGAGAHARVSFEQGYAFSRTLQDGDVDDVVVIAIVD
jgi:alpha-amylase